MTRLGVGLFVLRRLAALVVLLVVMSFAVFSLLYLAPGNPVDILIGTEAATPELRHSLEQQFHLDKPFLTQYWLWAKDAARFQFGESTVGHLPVADAITARLPTTLFLGIYAYLITMVLGVALGIASALKRRTSADRAIVAGALVGVSTPAFVSGIFLLYVFAITLGWFPVFGSGQGFQDRLWHLTLPAFALALTTAAFIAKHTRAAMMGVLDQDYVTFARARGLSPWRILFKYSLRNALIPVVTISGIILGSLIAGGILAEVTFSLPGIGQLLVQSANTRDLPVLQAVALIIAVVIMGANLLADLAYMAVDPRVRIGRRST